MKIKSIAMLMFAALLFVGCNDDDNNKQVEKPTEFDLMLDGTKQIANNASVMSNTVNENTGTIECNILVRNNTDKEMSITVTKEIVNGGGLANAADVNFFCWGICVGSEVTKLTAAVPAGPAVCEDPFFVGEMQVAQLPLVAKLIVRYVFTNDITKFSRTVNVTYLYTK